MARASWNQTDRQWVADFRGVGMKGQQRRRVRLDRDKFPQKAEAAAHSIAAECERYCRLLETAPQDPHDVDHAERIKAIIPEQAARMRANLPPGPATRPVRQWTLREAAAAHPSTQRDERTRLTEAVLNFRHLKAFTDFAGSDVVAGVKLETVLRWIAAMKAEKISWEGRRHRLLYLRRACRMATTQGLPDALAGLRIDHREDGDGPVVEAWTLPELARGALRLTDPRALAALGLGGFVGLRPSECFRLLVGEVRGVVEVGKRKAKTRASKRTLPLPPTVATWCAVLAKGRPATDHLFLTRVRGRPAPFTEETWAHWLGPLLGEATGRTLAPKCLRKSFATWAPALLAGRDVERYLGHASAFLAQVSSSAYQADRAAEELRPAAALIETAIAQAIQQARKAAKAKRIATAS